MWNVASLRIIIFCLVILSLGFCTAKKEISVPIQKEVVSIKKEYYSDLIINYQLDKIGIRDTFNRSIDDVFKSNFDMPENGIKMKLSKPKSATVEIEGKNILVVVPIAIEVVKETFLSDFKAKGVLQMSFITAVDIDTLWNLKTNTTLSHSMWVEKPKINIVGVNLPIETIANSIINQSKTQIEQSIDQSVAESFTLKAKMKETMAMFEDPIQMDTSVNTWLYIVPQKIELNKLFNKRFSADGKIGISAKSTFTTYKPAKQKPKSALPKVYWNEQMPDSSVFRVLTDIKMSDINSSLKKNMNGQSFEQGSNKITISNLITNCDFEFLKVVTDVSGTVNGQLIIKGKPKYDAIKNEFYMENIDISLKTKNAIHKAAAWIAEGKIRKEMEKMLRFSIKDNLKDIQQSINSQVSAMNKEYDIEMKVGVGSITVDDFRLSPGQIEAVMKSNCYLEVKIKDFRSFNKFGN